MRASKHSCVWTSLQYNVALHDVTMTSFVALTVGLNQWPIDGIYATPDLPVDASTWLEFMLHLGDHRFNVLDVNARVLVGDDVLRIICPLARRLSCHLPKAVSAYTTRLTAHMRRHKGLSKLHHLYATRDGNFITAQRQQLETLRCICSL